MEILKNFAALIKLKTIVTMVVTAIFAVLTLRSDITADNVMIVVHGHCVLLWYIDKKGMISGTGWQ